MKFIDFFAGIGGIRLGLEQAGHECVGFCEKDENAVKAYKAMYHTEGEWESNDIRTIDAMGLPKADIWTGGFPCQDISVAGFQQGIQGGTRSGLFFEIIRLLAEVPQENRPEWLLLENVRNLLRVRRGFDFTRVLFELDAVRFDVEWQVLNSKDFGVPQNRERVFIIGHNRDRGRRTILPITPAGGANPRKLEEITKGTRRAKRCYSPDGLSCTISAVGGGGGEKTGLYRFRQGGENNGERKDNSGQIL